MSNKPLLSICIPTKNRQKYCIHAITHILSYDEKDFELCIHDHSDNREIEDFVSSIDDPRLRYIYTEEAISSVENMSRSIEIATGEYIYMIGDDDMILPNVFKWVKYMKENDVDSLCPGFRPEYFWPNKETGNTGTLKVVQYKYMKKLEHIDASSKLDSLFKGGIIQYQLYNLPRVYHGLIQKNLLDQIYDNIGSYFGGLSPDIYSTVVLSKLAKNHVVVSEACSIAGACPISTTSSGRLNSNDGKLENAPHLINNDSYHWDNFVPEYYCGETIWAETAITAAKDFKMDRTLSYFNRGRFNSASLFYNKHISEIVIDSYLKNMNIENRYLNRMKYVFSSIIYGFFNLTARAFHKFFLKKTTVLTDISNISLAKDKVMYLK